LNRHDR